MFLISDHEGKPLEYEVRKDVVTIGRDVSCDISLNSTSVSRFHVQLKRDGDRLSIKDLGSRNGTRVNGAKVAEAVLSDGDIIQVGVLKMLFRAAEVRPPTGFEPVGTAGPVVPAAATPAARDVPPSPTPPDAGFAPEKYRQGLPSGGPKLVEREGKFYLQDASSGREVEIKPVGGGGDPVQAALRQLQGMSPASKRLMVLAGAALFCIAGITLAVLHKPKSPATPPKELLSASAYDARIDDAVGRIRQAVELVPTDVAQARAILARVREDLQALNQENPPRGTAVLVEQWALFWSGIEPDYSNFPWEEGLERLTHDIFGKLESHHYTTPSVRDLIGTQRQWIETQLSDKEEVLRVLRLVNGTTEEEWKQALQQLESLPSGTLYAESVRSRGPELRARIFALHEAKARDAFARQAWMQVRPEADLARPWGSEAQETALYAVVSEAEAEAGYQAVVQRTRSALDAGIRQGGFDPARVIAEASSVPEGSRYCAAAREILEQAESFRFAREIQNLFNQGTEGAQRALTRLDAAGHNPGGIRLLIEQTVAKWNEAQRHLAANEYDEAVACWGDLIGRLDAGLYGMNWFRQESEALRRQWSDPRRQAGEFHRLGTEAREARRYAQAVRWFERAVEKDPSHVRGTDELSAMEREARRLVGEASGGLSPNPVADVRRALEMVPTGFSDRRRWEEELRRLGGR